MTLVSEVGVSLVTVLQSIWDGFVNVLPGIVAALVVIIIGYIVGEILGQLVRSALTRLKIIDNFVKRSNLKGVLKGWDIPTFLATITKWYVFILFLGPAASLTNLEGLSTFLLSVALWVPNLIVGILIVFLGLIGAEYVKHRIVETNAKAGAMIGSVTKTIIIIIVFIIALEQAGIKLDFAENSILIVLAGIMLALGLAFGLGLKDEARGFFQNLKNKL